MTRRRGPWLVVGLIVLAVGVWKHELHGDEERRPRVTPARRAYPAVFPPTARRVASSFVRSLVLGDRAATRKVIDRTYPCGMGGPFKQQGRMFFFPLAKGYSTKGIRFGAPAMVGDSLVVHVGVRSRSGVSVSFQMELRRRGRDRWRVSYFDAQIGPGTPFRCVPVQTSS